MNRLRVRKGAIIRDRRALRRAFSNRTHRLTSLSISGVLALGMVSVVPTPVEAAACTSPTTSTNGNFTIVQFKTVESCTWAAPSGVSSVQVLIVGGGGAGGAGGWAGGGGAGSVLYGSSYSVAAGTNYTVTVGAGAAGNSSPYVTAASGSSSTFGAWTASGGGGGAGYGWSNAYWAQGGNGGSGGGAAEDNGQPAGGSFVQTSYAGATSYGNAGGKAFSDGGTQAGAGGGGAGSVGADAYARNGETRYPGNGGTGVTLAVGGTNFLVAAGGGGASSTSYGSGGSGIGGNGGYNGAGSSGAANTGSGGGGAQSGNGGNGGSGIVVISYQSPTSVSAPNSVSVTAAAQGLNVTWSAPTKSPGSVTGYRVEYSSTGTAAGSWTTATSSLSSSTTSYSITGLSSSTAYYVRVAAIYSSGTGPYGYPWTSKYRTTTSTRDGSGNIVYASGSAGQAQTSFSRVRYVMGATLNGSAQSVDANFDRVVSGTGSQGNLNTISNLQVPTPNNTLVIQGDVNDLTVVSSTGGLVTDGYGFTGRLELWGWDYSTTPPSGMSSRAANTYDDADSNNAGGNYGSFQLHNLESTSRQTIFAWNRHGGTPEIGFGNHSGANSDWTFCSDTGTCTNRTNFSLEIFVNEPTTPLPGTALTPVLGAVSATPVGYTFQISNYDAAYTWGGTATAGGTVSISGTGFVTVTGLSPSTSSTATITTTRTGYNPGSTSTSGTSSGPSASYNFSDLNSYNSASPGTVTDLSGNSRTGTVTNGSGGASPSWTQSNGTLKFPGGSNSTGPFIDLPNISTTPFNTYGVTVDFEADFGASKDNYERIIDFSEAGSANDNLLIARDSTTSNLAAEIYVGGSANRCTFTNAITENTLVRYTISFNGTNCQLWKDGVSFGSNPFTVKPAAGITWTDNFIGKSNWTGDAQYEGSIRSLRLYAGGFTPTQLGAFDYKTITYNANNGLTTPPTGITSGSLNLPAVISRTGYAFQGWYNGTNYLTATKRGNASAAYAPSSSETIYAGWSANSNTVTFNSNYTGGPTATTQSITTDVATALTANTFSRTGYTFAGWNTSADGLGTNYTNQQSVTLNANLALYAKWTANSNTVTFNSNYTGGPTATTQSITTDVATALTANTFSRTGYTFAGWNTLANGSGTKYTNSQSVTISAPLTLYATWYRISITTQPVGKASGTTLQTQPSVRIEDGNGNTVTSDSTTSITVAISSGAGGTLGGTKTLTVTNGVATFTDLTLAGTTGTNYVLTFTSTPSYFAATSQNVTVTPGSISAANSTVTPGAVTISADGVSTQTFTVTLKDAQGNTFTSTNDVVTFATNNSLGVFANATNKSAGVYEGVYTAGTSPGTDTVTVTANSVALSTKPVITLNPGVPDVGTSLVTASATSLTANGTSTSVITVRLKDPSGNNIPRGGATVTVRVASGPGNVGSVTDNGNGTYTATYTATTTAGSSLIKATVGGTDITDTETITLVPGAPAKLGVTTQPSATNASGAALSAQPVIAVQDAFGNTVTTDATRTITVGIVGTGGSVGGTITASTTSGVATFAGVTVSGLTSNTYRLAFTTSGLTSINSDLISITPGTASTATSLVTASTNSITANGTATSTITVTLKDAQGNLLTASGGTVLISKASGNGTVSATTNNNNGTYTATFTAPTSVGSTVIQATVGGNTITDTETITLVHGAAAALAITRTPVTGASGGLLTTQPQITLQDANGNTVTSNSSGSVTVSILSGAGGTLTGTKTLTMTNGVVSFTDLALAGTVGTDYVLKFETGAFSVNSGNLRVVAGTASTATSTVTASVTSMIANGTTTSVITVTLRDSESNQLTAGGATVALTLTAGYGSLSAVTDKNNGTYTATYTSGTTVGTPIISATLNTVSITDTETITLVHGPATKVVITQQPAAGASGTSLTTQPKVVLKDANNNIATSDSTSTVSVAILSGAGGTLGGTTTMTVSSGEAVFSELTFAGLVTSTYKLRFTSGSLTVADSGNVTVTPGAAVTSTSTITASSTSITANGSSTSAITVQLKDAQGNSLTSGGNAVVIRVNSGTGSVGSTTDAGNGTYTSTFTSSTTVGTSVIKATLSGADLSASQSISLTPGAAAKLGVYVSPPTTTSSGTTLSTQPQVVVQDAYGNTVTSDSGRTISIGIVGNNGSLGGSSTATTSAGIATFSGITLSGLTSESYRLSFSASGLTGINSSLISVTPGAASTATSVVSASTTSIVANGTSTSTITVTLKDAQSNLLVASGGTVVISKSSGGGSVSATTNNNDGTYTATFTSPTTVGTSVIQATVGGNTITDTETISLLAGAATHIAITRAPVTGANASNFATQPQITLLDANNNTVTANSSSTVDVTLLSGANGVLSGTTHLTFVNGVVNFTNLAITGRTNTNYVLQFTSGSFTVDSANLTLTPGVASASTSTVIATDSTLIANGATTTTITIRLKDAQTNALTTSGGTVTVAVTSGTGSLSAVTNNNDGTYTATYTSGTVVGTDTITATLGSTAISDTESINLIHGSATKIRITQQPVGAASGTALATQPKVEITDAFNNRVTTDSATVISVAISAGSGGTLGGTATATVASGEATFSDLTLAGLVTQSYKLTFSSGSLTSVQSSVLSVTPGAAVASTASISATSTSMTANGSTTSVVTVQLKDAQGNLLTVGGNTVTMRVNSGSGLIGSTTDNGNGTYAATYTAGTVSGSVVIKAALAGTDLTATQTFALNPGTATKLALLVRPGSSSSGALLSPQPQVVVQDVNGNTVTSDTGRTITVAIGSGTGGSLSGTLTANTANGVATFTNVVLAGLTSSNYVLDFTTPSLTHVTSDPLSVTSGSPQVSTSTFTVSQSSIVANGITTSTVTVTLRDAQTNALTTSGGTLEMFVTSGQQGSIGVTTDNNDGTYSATYTSGTVVSNVVITAKLNGVALTQTTTISLIPGTATQLSIATQPTGKASGTTLDQQPVIRLLDAFGNLATQDSTTQVTTAVQSGASGTLGGTKTVRASSGVVTFTDLTLAGLVSENYVLRFTSGSLTLADSANVTVTPGAATTMSITSGNNTSATVNTTVSSKPTVAVQDAQGNYVPNVMVTFATGTNSGIATGTSVSTNASGVATVGSWKLYTISGANTMTATATGTNSVTFTSTGIAAAPDATKSTIALSSGSVVVAGSPVGITVTIRDTYNNVVTDAAGTLVLSPTSGLGTISSPVNNNNGTYSAAFTPGTLSGSETISGSYAGSLLADQNLSVLPSVASQYLVTRASGTIVAGNAITVKAQLADQYGNSVPTSGVSVTWAATNGGSFATATSDTNASGLATISYTTNTRVANAASVSATDAGGLTGTLPSFATVPGVAVVGTSLVETSSSSLIANGTSTATITVTLKDANGNELTSASQSTVTISVGMSVGSVSSTTNNGDGTYTATYTSRSTVGTATISASLGLATITDTATISLVPGPATQVKITTEPVGSASGTGLATQPVAKLLDAHDNVITGDVTSTVSVAIQSGVGGTLGGTRSITVVNGVATFTDLTLAGLVNTNYVLRFTSGSLTVADSANVTVTPGAASVATSVVSTSVTSLIADSANTTTVTVTLKDAQGNQLVVGGSTVGITVDTLTAGNDRYGSIGSVTDNSNGTYTATYTAGTKVQNVKFTATLAGSAITDDAALALVHGTATKLAVQVQPVGGASGSALATQPVVLVQDANGNTVTSDSGRTVTATLGGLQNTGTLSGTRTGTSDQGVVTFAGIVMTGRTATNYVLAFSASGLTGLNSNNFSVNPGPTNTTNSVVSAANAVITANGITTSVITVTVKDTEGNTVGATAGTVVLSVTTGTGSLSTVIDNNDGTYTSTFTSGTVAGSATIAGTLNGTALGTSAFITLTPGPAHHTAVLVQPGDTASGALLSPQAQVIIQDRYNNTVIADSTSIITASLKSGAGGTLGGTLTATASAGIATFTNVTLAGVVGTDYVIEFNPNTSGVASVDSQTINLTPGTPTQLILSTQAATAKSGQAFETQPVLVAKDAQNNVATNFTAEVSATVSIGASTQGTTTKSLVNGVATFTDLGLYGTANANYTVTYTTSSLGLTTSQSILLSPGTADHLEIVTQPTSEMNGRVFGTQPVIQIRDAQNNAVPTTSPVNVVATISSGSGTLSGTQTIGTDSSGRSIFTNLMITGNTGNYRMTFTAGGLSVETSAFGLTAGDQTITPSAFGSTALPNGTYIPTASSYSGLAVAITLDASSAGVCSMSDGTVTFLKSGACKINYDQAGNTHWSAAPRVTETLSIGKLPQNVVFAAIDDQPFGGTDVALSATADSGLTVNFTVTSASTICTLATATTVHIVGLGTCTVNVSQAGDDVWLAAANNDSNHPLTRSFVIGTVRPATPTIASVSAGNAQATVSWNAPSHDGGSALLDYKVTAHPGGATCVSNDAVETSCIVTGLTNGIEYRFSVQARNAIGLSNDSENSPAVTPATTADAVTGLTLTSTNKKLTANWIKPVQLGGGAFVRYEMFIRETGGTYGSPFISRDANLETFEFTKTDPNDSTNASDLRNGESYDVKIVIITDAIMSGNSSAVELLGNSTEATQIPADVPAAPTDVTILTTTGHEANVSWVASNSDGGSVITSYEVLAKANNVVVSCAMLTPLDTSCAIAVLTPGERVEISVKAVNRIGRSIAGTATLTLPTVPAAATMNTVTVGNGFIHVEWSAPASDGGMALTGYIARAMVRGTDQVAAECTTASTGCDLILTGADYDFDFAVWATNRVGISARSNLWSPPKPAPTPTPSATRMRTPVTNAGAAAVIWDARKPMYMPSGDPVELPAGKTMAWRNGEFVEVNLVAAGTSVLQLSAAGGVVLQMQSLQLSGAPMDVSALGLMQVYHNRTIRIAGSGFAPNSIATVWMFSNEIKIGEVMTDANGAFAEVFPIGTNIPLGDHTIQINGEHKDGSVRTVAMGVNVMDEAFAPAEEEAIAPNSESSNQILGVIGAVGVAFLGGLLVGLLMISQRRRKS